MACLGAVRIFEIKLKMFRKQLENVNLCHFSSCDDSVCVLFPVIRAEETIPSLRILK
jgi:hypothetical protein